MKNNLLQVLSPNADDEGVWIHQDAWFSLGNLEKGFTGEYKLKGADSGVYAFVLEGDVTINGESLNKRDGLGISETDTLHITADADARLLLMEVPMLK
jgi:redox-sensitive bicupin YhaK (pirin superfamily)